MLEAVILSVSPSHLSVLKKKDNKLYQKVSYLKDDIEKPLASILTFNTIAHTIGAAGAGAEAQKLWGNEYLSLFSAVLTFCILVFSEIIPKSIGARTWKSLLPFACIVLRPMIFVSLPIVWLSAAISRLIKGNDGSEISRDEIPAMAELGLESGVLHKNEYRTLTALIDFGDSDLSDIVKPAEAVGGLPIDRTVEEALEDIKDNTYSRLIVFGKNRQEVRGYVIRKDILQAHIDEDNVPIKKLTKKILMLPLTTSAQEMFDRLLSLKAHIAAVVDDQQNFVGIITLEDLIEGIIGQQIYDEFDTVE